MSRRGIASAGSAAVLLFAVSCALRAAVFLAVSPLRPAFDEKVYVQRGEAIAELAQTLAEGERPPPRSLERMYAEGLRCIRPSSPSASGTAATRRVPAGSACSFRRRPAY